MIESALASLKRKDLQALAKVHGLKANKKSSDLIAALLLVEERGAKEEEYFSPAEDCTLTTISLAVGSSVCFVDDSDVEQEGIIKRINKISFRIVLANGTEKTIPKNDVKVKEQASSTSVSEVAPMKVDESEFVNDTVAGNGDEKHFSPRRDSLMKSTIAVSPIKKSLPSPTQTDPLERAPGDDNDTEKAMITSMRQVDDSNEGAAVLEEERLMMNEELGSPKKERPSIKKKKKSLPKNKQVRISVVATPLSSPSKQATSKKKTPSAKSERQPSIVPKTTATMRARNEAIAKKSKRMAENAMPRTPQASAKQRLSCSTTSKLSDRSSCTIDSSILDKIHENSRRFSSSWSSSKGRKSISVFTDKLQSSCTDSAKNGAVAKTDVPPTVSSSSITARRATVSASKNAGEPKSVAHKLLKKKSEPTGAMRGKQPPSVTVTGTGRPNTAGFTWTKPGGQHTARATSAVPSRPAATDDSGTTSAKKGAVRSASRGSRTLSVTPSRSVATKSHQPNPSAFLKRSSSAAPSRTGPGPAKSSHNNSVSESRSCSMTDRARPAHSATLKKRVSVSESENCPKPFKARPAPNFSKMHKHIFRTDKSVVNMVKENKQSAVGDKMSQAVADAFRAPITAKTAPPSSSTPHSFKPRTPLGDLVLN